jgi:hypothetical protein
MFSQANMFALWPGLDCRFWLALILLGLVSSGSDCAQTASTGALDGVALDPSNAVISGVSIQVQKESGGDAQSTFSDENGRFVIQLLSPGTYKLEASKVDFTPLILSHLNVYVTETLRLELRLQLAAHLERSEVSSSAQMLQTNNSVLGRIVNESSVQGLPLATRNFAQIIGLSPGVSVGVYHAGELGLGGIALSQIAQSNDGVYVHGARSYDNNYQMDGISVSDVQGSAAGSGGIPIPNPDSVQEFKVQTALYDAAFGRYGGANVTLVTRTGSDHFQGSVFEFLRNEVFNANEFFLNRTGQSRPILKQNQFGFALAGPILKDKLLFFGSYQGTRQVNGVAAGQSRIACTASLAEPPLSNDRSAGAIGRLFGGMKGALSGAAVNSDGSNINSVALALLNFKLPDGRFLIPTPQTVDSSKPLFSQGFSVFSEPCHFDEDQFSTNLDYILSPISKLAARFFFADDNQMVTFPGNGLNPSGNIPGFPTLGNTGFRVLSVTHTHMFRHNWLNEARFGYVRNRTAARANTAFSWSDIGVEEGQMSNNNELPSLQILGSVSIASGFPRTIAQNSVIFGDDLSLVRGNHLLRFGGSITRVHDNVDLVGLGSLVRFLSWPDFLLGLSAADNGTAFSNVFASFDDFGLSTREYRAWEGVAFAQDDYRIFKPLTLNIGLRYERLGQFADSLGRNASFDVAKANPNPPSSGSVDGYVVASNFPGAVPPGVTQVDNPFGTYAKGQDNISPRIGFAWQLGASATHLVLRGGYGTYYSRFTGQAFYQNIFGAPFSEFRLIAGTANANATFQAPFQRPFPTPNSFPFFPPYSPTSNTTVYGIAPDFRPSLIQQFSMNLQTEIHSGWLLEVAYVGTRGTHLVRQRSLNQALPASSNDPIRGVTADTVANIPLRVPILGIPADSLVLMEPSGNSWYNALEVSLTKRLNHGLQFLVSYTFSKTLDTDGSDINSTSSGNALTLGDQNSPSQRWGRASFDRPHRFVFSGTWSLPSPPRGFQRAIFGNWDLAAVATIQSGTAITITETNADNIFGISEDRAQLSGSCTTDQLVTTGPMGSKLNNYFNKSCFKAPVVIGTDGIGTAFGNSGTGIANGPGQANFDIAFTKGVYFKWPSESSSVRFRAEFFNAFNHPQFSIPDTNFSSPTFGVISSTSVNPRVVQLALRFAF